MNPDLDSTVEAMRTAWDGLARDNAQYRIASEEKKWIESDFFASGERDVARQLDPVPSPFQILPLRRLEMNGVPIRKSAMLRVCQSVDLCMTEIRGPGSQYTWFAGRKLPGELNLNDGRR